jgi:hypothetical protein
VPRLFLPQATLEQWVLDDKADLRDGKLVVHSETSACPVEPAVHFLKLVAGVDDNKLVSRVKTEAQLAQLGAERFEDSVVLGESAYEVVPGYVADVAAPASKNDKRQPNSPETDLLAAFILDKMS